MKIKTHKILFEVALDDDGDIDIDEGLDLDSGFTTKKEALEYINEDAMGKHFALYKTTVKRVLIKTINLKRPRPCHGGWYSGHRVSEEDKENENRRPFCTSCGYQLRLIHRNFDASYITDKPLVHKDDKK